MNPDTRFPWTDHRGGAAVAAEPLDERLSRAAYGVIDAIDGIVRDLGRRLHAWHVERATIRDLSALNDHILKDIGLDRSEIRSVAHALTTAAGGDPDRVRRAAANDNAPRVLPGPRAARDAAFETPRQHAG